MNNRLLHLPALVLLLAGFLLLPRYSAAAVEELSVALLPFLSGGTDSSPLDRTVTDVIRTRLQETPGITLFDHERLSSLAGEMKVDLSKPLSPLDEERLFHRARVQIVVSGESFQEEGEIILRAVIRGGNNGREMNITAQGPLRGRIRPLMNSLSEDISRYISHDAGDFLLPQAGTRAFYLPVCEEVAGQDLPRVFVDVKEIFGKDRRDTSYSRRELFNALATCGFTLSEDRAEAEVLIFGRATGRIRTKGRHDIGVAEIDLRAVEPTKGNLLSVSHTTGVAVDSSVAAEGIGAFREATATASLVFIPRLVRSWNSLESQP